MELKAFDKLYSEATEAIEERRMFDALALVRAIRQELSPHPGAPDLDEIQAKYETLLQEFTSGQFDFNQESRQSQLFAALIQALETARYDWLIIHKPTYYSRIAAQLKDYSTKELIDQIRITTRGHLGELAYHEAMDAAFGIAWCCQIEPSDELHQCLKEADLFVQRVLVGGLLLGVLESYSQVKIDLLMSLFAVASDIAKRAKLSEDDEKISQMDNDAFDLRARLAVAFTLIVQRYKGYINVVSDVFVLFRDFFHSDFIVSNAHLLLHAFVCQSLTDRVGQRVDDILPIVEEAFKNQQLHLGTDDNQGGAKAGKDSDFNIQVTKIDMKAGKKLFSRMVDYANMVDDMRRSDMDVNHSNFSHMKRFDFFRHTAHWFYPFTTLEPTIQKGVHRPDGKPDVMTLSIMDHSRFCDSDRYSYASMMAFLRRDGHHAISDELRAQLEEMRQEDDEESVFDLNESAEWQLNPFANYCQTCYRFLHSLQVGKDYNFAFAPTDDIILPSLCYFDECFRDAELVRDSVEAYLKMGDSEHAIILLDIMMQRCGATAETLELKGRALMQQRLWHRAISCFQQRQLMDEDHDTAFAMARCFEALHDWDSALPLLICEDERQEGTDADIIEEIARCLLQLNRWNDAVQRFFQLELMGEHLTVCQRGIGWCSLNQQQYKRAEKYYRQLIDNARRKQWEDYINLGHALWLQGRTKDAVEAYRQFVVLFNRSRKTQRHNFRHWTEAFREDARTLLAARFQARELAVMLDAIAMK